MAAKPPLSFSLNPTSSAATGDKLIDVPFNVSFGNKATGAGANAAGLPQSALATIAKQIAIGVAVAIAARYIWRELNR